MSSENTPEVEGCPNCKVLEKTLEDTDKAVAKMLIGMGIAFLLLSVFTTILLLR